MSPGLSLKGRALKYLSMREHSRMELRRKLAPHAESPEQVEQVLAELEQRGFLSEERFAESVVHRKASRYGLARVKVELAQHRLPEDLTREVTAQLQATEVDRALALWQRRFGQLPATPEDKARQMRHLAGRGFSGDTIRRVFRLAKEQADSAAEDPADDPANDLID